jgi:hypothetical protein
MVGTVAYMAPERFDSDNRGVTAAADVFAWGAVVAYAGTGRTPFAADSPAATAARILTQPPELSGLPSPLRDRITVAPPAPRSVRGPGVVDRLDRPAQWAERTSDPAGTCAFDRELVVTTDESGQVTCPGPADSFAGDQSIAVDVTVRRPGSCALVWFRYTGRTGYRLSACESVVRLDLDDDGSDTTLTKVASTAFRAGQRERLRIDLRGQTATVTIGDTPVFQAPITEPGLVAGQVQLGVATDTGDPPAQASFADAEFRSL